MSVIEIKGLTVEVSTEDGPKEILRGVESESHALRVSIISVVSVSIEISSSGAS